MNDSNYEDDDAWSYSFPPSLDDLPGSSENDGINSDLKSRNNSKEGENCIRNTSSGSNGRQSRAKTAVDDENKSLSSSESGTDSLRRTNKPFQANVKPRTSSNLSSSSASLQTPFMGKSTPADPKTTKKDANSIISKESLGNGLEETLSQSSPRPTSNDLSTARVAQKGNDETFIAEPSSPVADDTLKLQVADNTPSPKIIAYRKSRKSIKEGGLSSSGASPRGKYDSKFYVEETLEGTDYHYAIMKRNTEYHQLFKVIDLTDRLLDDFSCALSREILLQGRVYVSEKYICFNSNLLGWVTNVVLEMNNITNFERKTIAGLFPNGIAIETKKEKYTFASFLSRDMTFDFMVTVWNKTTGRTLSATEEADTSRQPESDEPSDSSSRTSTIDKFESYILSIDGDDDKDAASSDVDGNNSNENRSSSESRIRTVQTKLLRFKDDTGYKNMGPEIHPKTDVGEGFEKDHDEINLKDEIIYAPVGIVFDILFGSTTKFSKSFLESQKGSEISEYSKFHPMEGDPTKLERSYNYRKALDYSIGPKSTLCEVSEIIEHLNFADYVVVVTNTRTPDVPSGSSFSIMNRYFFTWGPNNTTRLQMSFKVVWTGKSWIKSVIEKQTLAGQKENAEYLLKRFRQELDDTTYLVDGPSIVTGLEETNEASIQVPSGDAENPVASYTSKRKTDIISRVRVLLKQNGLVVLLFTLFVMFMFQLALLWKVSETSKLVRAQLSLNSRLMKDLNSLIGRNDALSLDIKDSIMDKDNEVENFWKWVDEKHKRKLTRLEKVEFLTHQLNGLYKSKINGNNLRDYLTNKLNYLKKLLHGYSYDVMVKNEKNIAGELL